MNDRNHRRGIRPATGEEIRRRSEMEYWYSLAAQIIAGQQEELKEVMLDQMAEWTGRVKVDFEDLTIGEIVGWLIDCQVEIEAAGLIK